MLTAIKGEIDSNTVIVGDFNTPLSPVDRSSKMKMIKWGLPQECKDSSIYTNQSMRYTTLTN